MTGDETIRVLREALGVVAADDNDMTREGCRQWARFALSTTEPAPRDRSAPGETWQPDPHCCPICEWPYAAARKDGCVPGDCSYRPDDHDQTDRARIDRNRARYTAWKNARPVAGEGEKQ